MCDHAHKRGITVEGEHGTISGIEEIVGSNTGCHTNPEQTAEFVERAAVDSLAVAVDTSHGTYKFKPGQKPLLRFNLLSEMERLMSVLPIFHVIQGKQLPANITYGQP